MPKASGARHELRPFSPPVVMCLRSNSIRIFIFFPVLVTVLMLETMRPSDGSGTFSWGGQRGHGFGLGHLIGTTTGFLLRTILCESLVLMPIVKLVEKYTKHAC